MNQIETKASGAKKIKKYSFKKFCNDIHLWLGIVSAIILFVICLTGTVFVFHTEIEKFLYPNQFKVQTADRKILTADTLIKKAEQAANGKVVYIRIPASSHEVWLFSIKEKGKAKADILNRDTEEKNRQYYINPYTGAITGIGKSPAGKFFSDVEDIHRWFFTGKPLGKIISGCAAIMFTIIIGSGIIIWFPKKIKHWKEGFKIKFSAKWKRVNFDMHRAFGAYILPFILLWSLTGPAWSFEWYRSGMSSVLNKQILKKERTLKLRYDTLNNHAKRISYTQVLDTAAFLIHGNCITQLNIPNDTLSAITVTKTHTGFCSTASIDNIQIDPYSGKILKVVLFSDLPFGKKIATIYRAVHVGEIFGTLSKIIYFIACLIATSLPVTGVIIWLNKRGKSNHKYKIPIK